VDNTLTQATDTVCKSPPPCPRESASPASSPTALAATSAPSSTAIGCGRKATS